MNKEKEPLHAAINSKLTSVVKALASRPPWYDQWVRLGPASTLEERLAVYQAIRDGGGLPDEAGFYLVSWQIDAITDVCAEQALSHLEMQMQAIEQAHGLEENDFWLPDEAPAEYEELRLECEHICDRLFARKLEEFGEHKMAELFRTDPEKFTRLNEAGRQYFFDDCGSSHLASQVWLNKLIHLLAETMIVESAAGPLGYRYREEDGFWEVDVYQTPVEVIGGAHDGAVVEPGFSLDLERLRDEFHRIHDFGWNALGTFDPDGPYVWVEGNYRGREIYLRVLAHAPEDEQPGMKLDLSRRKRST